MLRNLMLFALLTLTAACSTTGSKEYIVPEDDIVKACIDDCQSQKTQCVARAQDIYRQCDAEYDYQERVFQSCRQRGLKFCLKPERCPPPDRQHCTNAYDGCFRSCGGYIETGKER